MRLLIVDDERAARARLQRMLSGFADVEVVAEADDGASALRLIGEHVPDAVMLDIQMPEVTGLELAASLPDPAPFIVFVTAHDHYALAAFDAAAIDYLLKPVEPQRLARAIERLRARLAPVPEQAAVRLPPAAPTARLLLPDRGRTRVVAIADILWLEAAENYVAIHTADAAPLMRRTMAGLLADLGPQFIRTHRSAAVNVAHLRAIHHRPNGDASLEMSSGERVPCSRQYRAEVVARLGAGD